MKKKLTLKRFISFLLCTAMVTTYMPSAFYYAFAEDGEESAAVEEPAKEKAVVQEDVQEDVQEEVNEPEEDAPAPPAVEAQPSEPEPVEVREEPVVVEEQTVTTEPEASGNDTRAGPADEEVAAPSEAEAKNDAPALKAGNDADEQEETESDDEDLKEEETWKVTFYNRDAEVYKEVEVKKGEAIGSKMPAVIAREDYNAFWAIGEIVDGAQGHEIRVTGRRVDSSFVPGADTTIVPDYDMITYQVTFLDENKAETIAVKDVDANTSYCLNDIPEVPAKKGHTGKWVYSGGDFSNNVRISADTTVWAEYQATEFTVTYKYTIDGNEKVYQTDKYYKGDELELPSDPVEEGREFTGWYNGETKINGGEAVTSDMELQGSFTDMYSVKFVVLNDDGTEKETLTQYFRTEGDTIGTMPQDPFVEGKTFVKWVIKDTETEVNADTVVNESFTAVAVFEKVDKYELTVNYWYKTDAGEKHVFDTAITQLLSSDLPYTVKAPASTKTDASLVADGPDYYAKETSVEVTEDKFDKDNKCTVEIEYVEYTAEYDYVYYLKDLEGSGYTEIERVSDVKGVLGSTVTAPIKEYDYATFVEAESVKIEQAKGQVVPVRYNRKTYQLSYETNGGSYVSGTSAPYGSQVTLSSTVPTKEGYTFAGWYLDEECEESAGTSVTLEKDTTVYAKWEGETVNYTIVYMFEKYNDAGTASSYVYDNSRNATAAVGSTVQAANAPSLSRTGWEADTAKNNESSAVVAADGSTVLYVYYKLTEYTFNFRPGTVNLNYGTANVTAPLNGESRTGNNNYSYSFKAKLGQDISTLWISAGNGTYSAGGRNYNVNFSGWIKSTGGSVYVTKRLQLTEDMLPGSGSSIVYQGYWLTNTVEYTVNYYLQNANDNNYTRSEAYSQTYNYSNNATLSPKDIVGYTHVRTSTSGRTTNFYYDRDTYNIDYFYGSKNLKTLEDIKFDASITGNTYNWKPTAAECGVDNDYTFAGWYSDAGLTVPYTFSTMPASNLVLYAKWDAPTFTVNFELDGGSPEIADQIVSKNHKVDKPQNPAKTGYTFEGWFDGEGQLFDWATQITEDTTIYAHWTQDPLSYTVHYVNEAGDTVAPDKKVTNPNFNVGDTVTEEAVAIAGYRPDQGSKSVKLELGDGNEITFVYSEKSEKTSYTVNYLLEGTTTPVHEPKNVEVNGNTTSVIEFAVEIPDYNGKELYPDEVEKSLTLGADESKNVINFYYSEYKSMNVKINFVDMNGNKIADQDSKTLKVGNSFTLSRTPVAGYELNKAVVGTSIGDPAAANSYKITNELVAANPNGLEFTLFYYKKLIITANSQSKQYDGTVLAVPAAIGEQVTAEGLVGEDTLTSVSLTLTGNDDPDGRLNAGVATVTPSSAAISGNGAGYYKIRYISGTLEVRKINVTVRVEPDRWTGAVYTGEEYKAGFTNPGKGIADYVIISHKGYSSEYLDDIWAAVSAKATYDESADGLKYYGIAKADVGDYTYEIGLTPAELPADENYSVSLYVRPGRLQILPKEVTASTESDSKPYDGTALTNSKGSIEGLVAADEGKVSVTGTGSITEPGTADNTVSISWGNVNSDNYIVTEKPGKLEVTKADLTVTVAPETLVYNGEEQSGKTEYTTEGLAEGHELNVEYTAAKGTNVSEEAYNNGEFAEEFTVTDADGNDVTSFYNAPTFNAGTLTITPAPLTITTESASKVYDGDPLTADGKVEGFVNGEEATFTVTGSQTEVGDSDNTYTLVFDKSAKESNYEIKSETIGKLVVTDSEDEIVVTTTGGEFTYDGQAHGATVSVSELPKGYTLETAASNATATDVTAEAVEAKCDTLVIKNKAGVDVTDKLNIRYVDGSIKINPATLTIVTPDANKVYDGEALTSEGTISGFVNDETATFKTTGSQTEVGESKNSYSLTWDGTAKESNYKLDETIGTLKVTENAAEITVKTTGGEFTYDGNAHGATVEVTGVPKGYTVKEKASSATATDVADGTVDAKADKLVIENAAGTDVTAKLNIKYEDGTIKINPATLTVVTESDEKVYDGDALTAEGSIEGFVTPDGGAQETATFEVTGSQTEVGQSANSYSLTWDGTAKESNYTLDETIGTLKVTESTQAIVVTTVGGEFTYDGEAHGATVSVSELPQGYTLDTAESNATATDVTTEAVEAKCDTLVIRNKSGKDVTKNLNITYVDGSITINPAPLTIKTESAEKVYDGDALTADGSIEGFVKNETATFEVTGSRTDVGQSENTYSLVWDGTAKESNYEISEEIGKLVVKKAELPEDPDDPENPKDNRFQATVPSDVVYNGGEQKQPITVTDTKTGKTLTSKDITVTYSEDLTNVGKVTITIAATEDGNYSGSFTRTYKITPAPLTIKTESAEKEYDGSALTASGKLEGLVNGETANFKTTGSQTSVGESDNTYSLAWDGTAKASNYEIVSEDLGKLKVTKASLPEDPDDPEDPANARFDVSQPQDVVYNGKEQKQEVTVTDKKSGKTLTKDDITITYSNDVQNVGTVTITVTANEDGNYKGSFTRTYKITPAPLTIKTKSASKVYDGSALKAPGELKGLVNGETASFTVTGSQTNVGESDNTYSLAWNGTAKESNYQIISREIGKLKVTKAALPEDPDDPKDPANVRFKVSQPKDVVYNGADQKQKVKVTDTKTGKTLTSKDVTVTYSKDLKNVGKVTITIKANKDSNYSGSFKRTYKITPAPLTITTGSDSKAYDGSALTSNTAEIKGLVGNDSARVRATGSQTEVGSSRNTYSISWKEGKASNYKITERLGTLRVTAAGNPTGPVTPGPGPAGPGTPAVVPAVTPGPPAPAATPDTTIDDEPTPTAEPEVDIPEPATPLAAGTWALINLIAAILTTLGAIVALFRKKEDGDEDEDDQEAAKRADDNEEDEDDNRGKKMLASKIAGAVAGIAAPIAFILTEDMSLPMAMIDKWTLMMVVILAVQVVAAVLNKKASKLDDDNEENEAAAN